MKNKQSGIVTVEFAIVGLMFFMVLFSVIEIGRVMFIWNTLAEVTRRGARVASVCPINSPAIANVAIFHNAALSGTSSIIHNLSTKNIQVQYLDDQGLTLNTPIDIQSVSYVQVSIIDYQLILLIPNTNITIIAPSFIVTLPSESLGFVTDSDTNRILC